MGIFAIAYLLTTIACINDFYNLIYIGIATMAVAILFVRKNRIFSLILYGVVASMLMFSAYNIITYKSDIYNKSLDFTAEITENEIRYDTYSSAMAKVTANGTTFKAKIMFENNDELLTVADKLEGYGYFYEPTNKRGFNAVNYYKSQGFDTLLSIDEYEVEYNEKITFSNFFNNVRMKLKENIDIMFEEKTSAVLKGLIFGDKTYLDYETKIDINKVGISHILAVSGLHLSFLFGISMIVFRKAYGYKVAGVVTVIFALVVGFSPSIFRACIMQLCVVFAWESAEEYSSINAISAALLILLAFNPYIVYDVGFVLSFASSFSIIIISPYIRKVLKTKIKRLNKYFIDPISIYLSVFIGTLIPMIYYFDYISTMNLISNIFILPISSILFPLSLLFVFLSLINVKIISYFSFIIEYITKFLLLAVSKLSSFKYSVFQADLQYIFRLIVIIVVSLSILFLVKKFKKTTIIVALIALTSLNYATSYNQSLITYMNVFYVGDGECILLKTPDEIILIDCGSSGYINAGELVNEFMYEIGEDTIDHLIITSIDKTHIKDINSLNLTVNNLYFPEKITNNDYADTLAEFIDENAPNLEGELPNFVEIFDSVDKKLVVKVYDMLFLHSLTNNMIDEIMEKENISGKTIVIADKVIEDGQRLYEQLLALETENVVLSNDYEPLDTVSRFPAKSTIKYGDIKIEVSYE